MLVSHSSHVWLCATPETAALQAPPSLGFSRQEHWSGLPFPSPMHESEKSKWSRSVMSDSSWPHGLQPTRLLHPWDFPGKSTGVGCHCLLQIRTIAAFYCSSGVSQVALVVRNLPANAGEIRDVGFNPRWGRPLEEGIATHSSILDWNIPCIQEPGTLQSIGLQRVGHDWSDLASMHWPHTMCQS